ncbi:MAG: Ferrous-iron efflux pump FieF [Ignavibacteria bacterium]|nr:Ferrous-iron efflux pump FieF [Ignavibacteria bacterium]
MEKDFTNKSELKIKVARQSLYAAVIITLIKLLASYFSGSLGILSEVLNSSIDIMVCLITIISIKYSSRPPDEDHNYGHEKAENFSALFQVLILFFIASFIIYKAIIRLFIEKDVELSINIWIFLSLIAAIIIDIQRARVLKKTADETKSSALSADALHFSTDILASFVVIAGLLLTYFKVSRIADTIAALIVSIIIIYLGYKMLMKSIDVLMDRVPAGLHEKIKYETLLIKGVEEIKSIRLRNSGPGIYVDMIIFVSRILPFSKVHDIMDNVEKKIMEIIPDADIVIHSEPVETKDETINDKIRIIVSECGYKCHDIFSHKISNEIYSELHIEISSTNDLIKAHDIVTGIEEKLKEEIPIIKHIKIHIDEPSGILFDTQDITENSDEMIRDVQKILNNNSDVISGNEIQVVSTNGKIRISMNCMFNFIHSLDEVHDIVTILESKIFIELKEKYPKLSNVIIHAEPSNKKA